ncbi:MAG: ATP-binding protein, partial [Actinobacteria bacterium]
MYERALVSIISARLAESRRTIQVVLGPRQVGKTTAVRQALERVRVPWHCASADTATSQSPAWLDEQWAQGRNLAAGGSAVLVIDEVQKVPDWSAWVKRLWDEDTFHERDLKVVLLGSSPLLMQQGLSESLAGRFEVLPATHWTWAECEAAFGWDLDTWIFHGGYPGGAPYLGEPARWRDFIVNGIVEATVSRDVLLMTRIDKPALLRRVFGLACEYSGRELTFEKMRAGLHDAGNTTTVAHYLDLLDAAGLVGALQKYSG